MSNVDILVFKLQPPSKAKANRAKTREIKRLNPWVGFFTGNVSRVNIRTNMETYKESKTYELSGVMTADKNIF